MHDNPRATETEQEQGPERIAEEESMRGPEHDDPELPTTDHEEGSD
ncbi:MAG TPA: hypothetical protein VEY87_05835 [Gaiellaceae bacterium]|jgi:hypothetical protein|nr:hypothetical protein [Gaiellaceae bacterium]